MLAGLPYVLWPVGSCFILASRKKDDPYLHYHAVQGLIWGAIALALSLLGFLGMGLFFRLMPGSSTYLPGMIGMAFMVGCGVIATIVFFTAIFLAWRATAGEMLRLPFIGDFAEQRMLDHTGMTRRDFMKMLEESFIEPAPEEFDPIPFPTAPVLSERAQEVLAQRPGIDATPASVKAAEALAERQARQVQARAEEARRQAEEAKRQAALAQQQKAAELRAQQAAAVQASQQRSSSSPAAGPGVTQTRPAPAENPTPPPRPTTAGPSGLVNDEATRAKSYPLIGSKVSNLVPTSPSAQRTPPPPARTPSGQVQGASNPAQAPAQPKVKDVDLVRHYKERSQSDSSSDALKGWLSSVEKKS